MALVKCHECGKEMSTGATACPNCGAKPSYRPGVGIVVFGIVVFLFGYFSITSNDKPRPPPQTEAERIAAEVKERRTLVVTITARKLKESMREPSSLEWIDMLTNENADVVCFRYRARNGFGGMSVETMTVTTNEAGPEASLWNRHCAGAELYNMMRDVKHAI